MSFDALLLGCTLAFIFLFFTIICYIWQRQAHYDCSKCKDWTCPYHHCKRMREKYNYNY